MNIGGMTRIKSFGKDNYDTWKFHMEALLIKNDAWSYVNGESVKPEVQVGSAASEAPLKAWEKNNAKAKFDIVLAIWQFQIEANQRLHHSARRLVKTGIDVSITRTSQKSDAIETVNASTHGGRQRHS